MVLISMTHTIVRHFCSSNLEHEGSVDLYWSFTFSCNFFGYTALLFQVTEDRKNLFCVCCAS